MKKTNNKVIINEKIDLPLPPNKSYGSSKGFDERKSSSPQSNNETTIANQDDNDTDNNINNIEVTELVTPFITDYVYDINDIKLPRKLLYEGKQLLLYFNTFNNNNINNNKIMDASSHSDVWILEVGLLVRYFLNHLIRYAIKLV